MQQPQLDYASSHRPRPNWLAIFNWAVFAVGAWFAVATCAIVLYGDLVAKRGWPNPPQWFDFDVVWYSGALVTVMGVALLGRRGMLPWTKDRRPKAAP